MWQCFRVKLMIPPVFCLVFLCCFLAFVKDSCYFSLTFSKKPGNQNYLQSKNIFFLVPQVKSGCALYFGMKWREYSLYSIFTFEFFLPKTCDYFLAIPLTKGICMQLVQTGPVFTWGRTFGRCHAFATPLTQAPRLGSSSNLAHVWQSMDHHRFSL